MKIFNIKFNSINHGIHTLVFFFIIILSSSAVFAETLTGTLGVVWGDSQENKLPSKIEYSLEQSDGNRIPLKIKQTVISNAGGLSKIACKIRVVA